MEAKHWQDVEKDWKFYYDEGKSYIGTSGRLIAKKGTFDNEFIYHLAVLAGERLVLGLLLSYNHIPMATSLGGMMEEAKEYVGFQDSMIKGTGLINKFQNFCALDVKRLTVPEDEDLKKIVEYIQSIEEFCDNNLNKEPVLV